ncbi:MAG: tRNA (N(6)-L-threonylcarbamoyladenosine(37)-C(2))-methylthiotransferase [Candidatus Aenigmatarchaeota archaeon]
MNRIYIETYGCTANQSDGEIMKGLLNRSGFQIVNNEDLADIFIINTCSVKQTTENKIRSRIKELKRKFEEQKIIVSGCMPESEYDIIRDLLPNSSFVSTHHVKDIPKAVKKVIQGKNVEYIGKTDVIKLQCPKIRDNRWTSKVQISRGCINRCSFCNTKVAKGDLFSYPKEKIIEEVKKSIENGCKEIQITSQDTGCYGFDRDSNLVELLKRLVNLPGKFKTRIGMLNPHNLLVKNFLDDLIEVYRDEKIYKFLHIPVQSGSNKILDRMKRNHTVEDFLKVLEKFSDGVDDLNLWTDFIVGFPGETEEDFHKSMELLEKIRPDHVNISRFTPRPDTEAKEMNQIDSEIKKERSRKMSKLVRNITAEKNKLWDEKKSEVFVNKKVGRNKYKGRNESYKPVILNSNEDLRGKFVQVKLRLEGNILLSNVTD